MKKLLITIIAVLVLAGIAVITCPDKQAHKEAIMAVINEKIDETVSGNASEGDKEGEPGDRLGFEIDALDNIDYLIGEVIHFIEDNLGDRLK